MVGSTGVCVCFCFGVFCILKTLKSLSNFFRTGKLISSYYNVTYWPLWYIGKSLIFTVI